MLRKEHQHYRMGSERGGCTGGREMARAVTEDKQGGVMERKGSTHFKRRVSKV